MNLKLASTFLAVGLVALSGCVVQNDPNPNPSLRAGDVNFTWSLAGRTCAENTHISEIRIRIPGESLASGGIYPCAPNGTMGIILHDFHGGTYSYTIEAVDHMGVTRYDASGTFRVDGTVSVHAELRGNQGLADFFWSFPPSGGISFPTCEQAGVRYVQLYLDGIPVETEVNGGVLMLDVGGVDEPVIPCEFGTSVEGFRVQLPHDGVHQVEIYAMDEYGYTYYSTASSVASWSGGVTEWDEVIPWAVGTAAVDWDLIMGGVERTCEFAGVDMVSVNFADSYGLLYGEFIEDGELFECDEYGMYNEFLPAGTFDVYVAGLDAFGDVIFLSDENVPPVVTVEAGYFCAPNVEHCDADFNHTHVDVFPY